MTGQVMSNGPLGNGPSDVVDAFRCLVPETFTLRDGNVATPLTSVAIGPPPLNAPVPTRLSVTGSPCTGLANASVTLILTAEDMVAPASVLDGWTSYARFAAPAALMSKLLLETGPRLPLVAWSCFVPTRSTERSANVASPTPSVFCDSVPESVPPPLITTATDCPETGLPKLSVTLSSTAGPIAAPATVLLGCTWYASAAGAAALIVKLVLATGPRLPVLAESCLPPASSTLSVENVAIPLASVDADVVPLSVPEPTRLRDTSSLAIGLLNASVTFTRTAGAMVTPAVAFEGCWSNASTEGTAASTVRLK